MPVSHPSSLLQDARTRLQTWLVETALPFWVTACVKHSTGDFAESIDIRTKLATSADQRLRVQARQIYSFVECGRLGWDGPWERIAQDGLSRLFATYTRRDGLLGSAATASGHLIDPAVDIYDHAFVLFALAHMAQAFPEDRDRYLGRARSMLNTLNAELAHDLGGFREASPHAPYLRANPHMHFLEAALALERVDEDPVWLASSDAIVSLAMERFIDPSSGALSEFFDTAWCPPAAAQDRVVEPGHQFEWAWLLLDWGQRRRTDSAVRLARRLYEIGKVYGVDARRGVAVLSLDGNFNVTNPVARLWGQTEWLKAALSLARLSRSTKEEAAFIADAVHAIEALERFFDGVPPGLWRDKLNPDGTFVEEPAPASSLYHIVCAISELCAYAGARDDP